MPAAVDHAQHSAYSNPGRHVDLVTQLPTDPMGLSAVARNVIVHYRSPDLDLPPSSRYDINLRWLEDILSTDQNRHPVPLAEPRESTQRVQGCCRDHTLFCVGVLRSHGIPARSRVGFAGYFEDGWNHDHLIPEVWLDGRWRRFDPELEEPKPGVPDPTDITRSAPDGGGFATAAQVWAGHCDGDLDPDTYGVSSEVPMLRGERFIFEEVIYEVAHRFGDELLLWDCWGRMDEPGQPVTKTDAAWLGTIADLLLAADDGDQEAEQQLLDRYHNDRGLRPGETVLQASPLGDAPIEAKLIRH